MGMIITFEKQIDENGNEVMVIVSQVETPDPPTPTKDEIFAEIQQLLDQYKNAPE